MVAMASDWPSRSIRQVRLARPREDITPYYYRRVHHRPEDCVVMLEVPRFGLIVSTNRTQIFTNCTPSKSLC